MMMSIALFRATVSSGILNGFARLCGSGHISWGGFNGRSEVVELVNLRAII